MTKYTAAPIGFLAAPLVSALMGVVLTPAATETGVLTALGFVVLFYCISILVTAFLGVPLFLILLKFELVRWWSAVAAGVTIGAVVALIIRLPASSLDHLRAGDFFVLGSVGAVSAFCFWLIWKQGNDPDS